MHSHIKSLELGNDSCANFVSNACAHVYTHSQELETAHNIANTSKQAVAQLEGRVQALTRQHSKFRHEVCAHH